MHESPNRKRHTFHDIKEKSIRSFLHLPSKGTPATLPALFPVTDFIIRFVELCLGFFFSWVADTAAAVASDWSHVCWKNRPPFVERLHAWSGREPVGYRGHNPNTPTPPVLLTRHADGGISIVGQEFLPTLLHSLLILKWINCLGVYLASSADSTCCF